MLHCAVRQLEEEVAALRRVKGLALKVSQDGTLRYACCMPAINVVQDMLRIRVSIEKISRPWDSEGRQAVPRIPSPLPAMTPGVYTPSALSLLATACYAFSATIYI